MADNHDLTPLLDTQQNQLSIGIAQGDSLDSKVLAVAAINVAVLIFVAQAGFHLPGWAWALLLAPFLGSLYLNGLGAIPRKDYRGPSVDIQKYPEYLSLEDEALVLQLIADVDHAIKINDAINARYWRFFLASIALTILGTVVLFGILSV